ncbi:hypothetical protein PIB30_099150 [Stylosanthes scabra]|uniref:Uncharacterized protein n=1 Tax=Stylosanthes scabra TaxID=79078 RepID=A0ABU6WV25_9FABA|nr:hypothetical protein [Stylosanthes scabra]
MWDITIHPPKGAQCPRWHIDSEPALILNVTIQLLARYCPLWSVGMMGNAPPRSPNLTGAQCPRWHIDSEPALIPSVTVQPLARYCPLWSVGMMGNAPPHSPNLTVLFLTIGMMA